MPQINTCLVAFQLALLFLFPLLAHSNEFMPKGLYDIHTMTLDNGLEVYLAERHASRSIAIRLLVNTGSDDFSCGKSETAHFLEHLLFTGTSTHSESELDSLIEDNGGTWNAYTDAEQTVYEIDIFSHYGELAMNVLHEIMTDSQITPENVERSRDIVHREMGGKPSRLEQYLFDYGIGKSAGNKAAEILFSREEYCPRLESADSISRKDILYALKQHYVSKNMVLFVVGDFNVPKMKQHISETFGRISSQGTRNEHKKYTHDYKSKSPVSGTLSPILGNEANLSISYRVSGNSTDEAIPLFLASLYLTQRMFEDIRTERGLSYDTGSSLSLYEHVGILDVYADLELEDVTTTTEIMFSIVRELWEKPLSDDELERLKRIVLLNASNSLQSNPDVADFYLSAWKENMPQTNEIENIEIHIMAITPEVLHTVAKKYLMPDRAVIIHDTPTLTYTQFYVLLMIAVFSVILILWRLTRKTASKPSNH